MKKGTKLKYRGIGFDTATGDYDMILKESLFANVIFFSIKSLSPTFLNWKNKIFLVEEKLRMDNMLHAC